jgi:hypothetical protein
MTFEALKDIKFPEKFLSETFRRPFGKHLCSVGDLSVSFYPMSGDVFNDCMNVNIKVIQYLYCVSQTSVTLFYTPTSNTFEGFLADPVLNF